MRAFCRFDLLGLTGLLLCLSLSQSGCNQTSGYVMNESGKGYYAQGNFTGARREFERALMDSPENPNYAFNVASAMRKQGDLIGAERMYQRALNLDPRHQPAHHELASMLNEQGNHEQATAHIQEWVATQPYQPNAHVEQAWMQRQQGDLASAERSLKLALRQKPNHPTAMAQLADVYQQTGRPQEAQNMYRRSLSLNPFQPEVKARVSRLNTTLAARPRHAASYAPPIQAYPQTSPTMSVGYPIQQASYQMQRPYQMQPRLSPQTSQWPIMQAGGIPQAYPAGTYASPTVPSRMMPAPTSQAYGPMPVNADVPMPGSLAAPITNADPAHVPLTHVPLTMSNTPIVSPF